MGERTKALESKVGQIEGRQQEGMFHPRDHETGGRFYRDDVDAWEPGQRSAGRWVLERSAPTWPRGENPPRRGLQSTSRCSQHIWLFVTEPGAARFRREANRLSGVSSLICNTPSLNISWSRKPTSKEESVCSVRRKPGVSLPKWEPATERALLTGVLFSPLGTCQLISTQKHNSQMSNPYQWDKGTRAQAGREEATLWAQNVGGCALTLHLGQPLPRSWDPEGAQVLPAASLSLQMPGEGKTSLHKWGYNRAREREKNFHGKKEVISGKEGEFYTNIYFPFPFPNIFPSPFPFRLPRGHTPCALPSF